MKGGLVGTNNVCHHFEKKKTTPTLQVIGILSPTTMSKWTNTFKEENIGGLCEVR